MNNVYPVTSTRRRKGAARGRESNVLHSPYETCTWFFKTMTSKVAILLYVAIFSVLGQSALAQTCATSATLTPTATSICVAGGVTNTAVSFTVATTPANGLNNATVNLYRNGNSTPVATVVAGASSTTITITDPNAPLGTNLYDVAVFKTNCGNVQTAPQGTSVTVNAAPQVAFGTASQTICSGAIPTFDVVITGPTSGTLSFTYYSVSNPSDVKTVSGISASSSGTTTYALTPDPVPTGTTTYQLQAVYSSTGCNTGAGVISSAGTYTVTVEPQIPVPNIITPGNICQGGTLQIVATIGTVSGTVTGQWYKNSVPLINSTTGQTSVISGATTTTLTITNVQPGDAGQYFFKICTDDQSYCGDGCATSNVVTAIVNPLPTATITPSSQNGCIGAPVTYTINFTGTGPFNYTWVRQTPSGTVSSTVSNISGTSTTLSFTPTVGGTYTTSISSVQDVNCVNTQNQNLPAAVVATVSNFGITVGVGAGVQTVCYNGSTSRTFTPTGAATTTFTYSLQGPVTKSGTATNTVAFTLSGLTAGSYTLTATDGSCTVYTPFSIAQYPQFTVTAATTAPIACNGGQTSVTVTIGGGSATDLYDISVGGTVVQTGVNSGTYTVQNVSAGTLAIVVTNTSTNNCPVSTSLNVLQPTAITVTATPGVTAISCFGGTTQIAVSATGGTGGTYTFTLDNGTTQTRISNVSSGTFTNVAGGTYTVSATDAAGCPSGTLATVNIAPATEIMGNAQAGAAQCNGGSGTITVNYTGGGASGNHIYSIQGPSTMASTSTSTSSYTFTGVLPGTYTATITDANGCSKVVGVVTVTAPAAITASVTAGTIACPGGTTTITIGNTSGGRGTGNFIWTLTSATGGTTTISATSSGNYFYPVSAGTYTVSVNEAGCPAQFVQSVTISEPAAIVASFTKTDITCTATTSTVTVSATGGSTATKTYQLVNANTSAIFGTQTNASGSATFSGVPVGTYNWVVTSGGCTVSSDPGTPSTQIVVAPYTAVTVGTVTPTAVQCFGSSTGSIQVSATGGSGSLTYAIQSGTYSNSNQTGSFTGLAGGTYTITVTDALGCSAATRTATVGAGTASGTGAPDLVLAASTNPSTFPTVGSSVTITYGISNTSGNAASGVVLRVSKPTPGYSIELASGVTGWTKTLDNDNVVEFTKATDILCSTFTPIQLPVVVTRTSETAKGTFAVTGTVRSSVPDAYDPDNVRVLTYSAQ